MDFGSVNRFRLSYGVIRLCVLIILAHKLRKKYRLRSSVSVHVNELIQSLGTNRLRYRFRFLNTRVHRVYDFGEDN